jgi:hypothetical protein
MLDIASRVGAVVPHACRDLADAVLNLDFANRGARAVRVDGLSVGYLSADRVLRTDDLGPSLFGEGAAERRRKVLAGALVEWSGLCLDRIPPDTDRIRLDFSLSAREGMSRQRFSKSVDLEVRPPIPPVLLRIPFAGYWQVTQGHYCGTNHRLGGFGGDYAWDFVHFGPTGRTVTESYEATRRNEESYSYGLAVLAPVDGTVARAVTDVADNQGLKEYPRTSLLEDLGRPAWIFGNFVVIDTGSGAYVLVAHLKQGERIASCGNSGNSVLPHLHIQVMDRPDPIATSVRGLPARFENYREITHAGDAAHKDILVRAVAAGDPAEGSIVVALSADETRP